MDNVTKLLLWYHHMGVDEIIANKPRAFAKANIAVPGEKANEKSASKIELKVNEVAPQVVSTVYHSLNGIIANARAIADKCETLEQLEQEVRNFDGCILKKTANKTVFCDGNNQSEIMVIGEAPGANEDIQGIPFCGDSGKLMDLAFSNIGLSRSTNIYISNSIFWRPPGNRKPTPEEIAICLPFVEKHIALVAPKLLLLVGATAVSSVLNSTEAVSKMRQKFSSYNNQYLAQPIATTILFHPSYWLRQPTQKRLVWQDLLKIKQYIKTHNIKL